MDQPDHRPDSEADDSPDDQPDARWDDLPRNSPARAGSPSFPPPPWTFPTQIGTCQFFPFGHRMIAVRCPSEFAPLMRRAGATWDPGSQRWLIHMRRVGPVIRALRRQTDRYSAGPA
jgi:hypothetical protein